MSDWSKLWSKFTVYSFFDDFIAQVVATSSGDAYTSFNKVHHDVTDKSPQCVRL